MKVLTPEQKFSRWEYLRELKNAIGRLSADYILREERSMFAKYWSKRGDVCLGVNEGWFMGPENVKVYYAAEAEKIAKETAMIKAAFPEELGVKSEEEIYGVGMMDYKPVDTGVIEIAGDGLTAKGLWCVRGSYSKITEGGPAAYWEWAYFAVDFILEDDEWKIWHMQYLKDIDRLMGKKWTGPEHKYKARPEWSEAARLKSAAPNAPAKLRETWHPLRPFTPSPRLPEPYETFADTFSYGIEVANA